MNLTNFTVAEVSFANKGNTSYGQSYSAVYSRVGNIVYVIFNFQIKTISTSNWYTIFSNLPFTVVAPFSPGCFIGSDLYTVNSGIALRDMRFEGNKINIFLFNTDSNLYIRSQMYVLQVT